MTNTFCENLKFLRHKQGWSVYEMADRLGLRPSTVYRLEDTPNVTPRERTIMAISDLFGVDPDDLKNKKLSEENFKTTTPQITRDIRGEPIPVIDTNGLAAKMLEDLDDVGNFGEGAEMFGAQDWLPPLPYHHSKDKKTVAWVMQGEALEPTIKNGDTLYVDGCFDKAPPKAKSGDFVLATAADTNHYVRKLVCGDNGEQWLVATNPDYPGERSIKCKRIHGVVVGLYRRF